MLPKDSQSLDIVQLNHKLGSQDALHILAWSWDTFGPDLIASSSFQTQSVALLHMISQICPELPIYFTDTGYHFPETLAFRDQLAQQMKLNLHTLYPDPEWQGPTGNPFEPLYLSDPDLCCRIHKVAPMARALTGKRAWVTGIRRDQTESRSNINIVELWSDRVFKIHPMARWTRVDLWAYIDRYNLPVHPLLSQGYASVGCAPCTQPITAQEDDRAGRWARTDKMECGLHTTVITEDENSVSELERKMEVYRW